MESIEKLRCEDGIYLIRTAPKQPAPALERRKVYTTHKDNILFRSNLNFSFQYMNKQVLEAPKFQSTQFYLAKFPGYTYLVCLGLASRLTGTYKTSSLLSPRRGTLVNDGTARIKSKTYVTTNGCGSGQRRL